MEEYREEYKKAVLFFVGSLGGGRTIPESTINSWAEVTYFERKDAFMAVREYFEDLDKNQSVSITP